MKFETSVVAIALATSWAAQSAAFQPIGVSSRKTRGAQLIARKVAAPEIEEETKTGVTTLTRDLVSKLRFREAKKELEQRELDAGGTLTDMRSRLRELAVDGETYQNNANVRVVDSEALNNVRKKCRFDNPPFSLSSNSPDTCFFTSSFFRLSKTRASLSRIIPIRILILTARSRNFTSYQKGCTGKKLPESSNSSPNGSVSIPQKHEKFLNRYLRMCLRL